MTSTASLSETLRTAWKRGLRLGSVQVLLSLHEQGGDLTMSEIAKSTGRNMESISTLVESLVCRGLVSRIKGRSDRRKVFAHLTAEGETIVDQLLYA
jgi:DNA-binding MarR family transcriptional regulator